MILVKAGTNARRHGASGSGEEGEAGPADAAMTWFQRLLLLTIALTFALVIIGGTVRATGSGLGCPDWPTCHGQLIPPAEKHTLIEFSHRTAASVVGVVFLGVTFFAFKTERRNTLVFWLAFSAGLLLVAMVLNVYGGGRLGLDGILSCTRRKTVT